MEGVLPSVTHRRDAAIPVRNPRVGQQIQHNHEDHREDADVIEIDFRCHFEHLERHRDEYGPRRESGQLGKADDQPGLDLVAREPEPGLRGVRAAGLAPGSCRAGWGRLPSWHGARGDGVREQRSQRVDEGRCLSGVQYAGCSTADS